MLVAFATFALIGLWEESMQTLALMLVAVALSLLIGIPLGIVAGRSDRFRRAITPVLDAMQIVPPFAYLMPVVILFSIGPAAAVVSTMIYAIPPAIRITALGIRGVPVNTVEAATSMGATRTQMLRKVQLPLARRMILLGVNQTILFALSMVVIAGLIGGGGLGAVVTSGLYSNPALAILAGLVIVVMAMALDRSTEAIANRTDPAQAPRRDDEAQPPTPDRRARSSRSRSVVLAKVFGAAAAYPDEAGSPTADRHDRGVAAREDPGRARLRAGPDHVGLRDHRAVGNFILQELLLPLQRFLVDAPWFATVAGLTAIAFVVSGLRPALTTLAMLGLIGVHRASGRSRWTRCPRCSWRRRSPS